MAQLSVTFGVCGCLLACLGEPRAGQNPQIANTVAAEDARGVAVALDMLPRRPHLIVTSVLALTQDSEAPWLFTGASSASLIEDLERLPLAAQSRARLCPTRRSLDGHTAYLEPDAALRRGATYTLALPRSAAGGAQAWTSELHVADSDEAGAALLHTYPAAEASDVPARLAVVLASFDGWVDAGEAGIWLEDAAGRAVPGQLAALDCGEVDSDAVSCRAWYPDVPLEPGSRYRLRSGSELRDAHGAELPELSAAFTTASGEPPAQTARDSRAPACALDEQALPFGCALVGDELVRLRLTAATNLRIRAELGDQRKAQLPDAVSGAIEFSGLAPDRDYDLAFETIDPALNVSAFRASVRTAPALLPLSITEVYADPEGPEPAQEFVELLNFGSERVPLRGLTLADSTSDIGTRIDTDQTLAAGARALLVSDSFDPSAAQDPAPAPGAQLIRVGKTLTRGGLSNAGQPLYLRDAAGHRLSGAPATPAPRPGQCLVRVTADPRSLTDGSFDYAPNGCTPGY